MITKVHRVYDKRPDVFKYVVISDDFREFPQALMQCAQIPSLNSEVVSDDGRLFLVVGKNVQQTDHPLIWEALLQVAEIEPTSVRYDSEGTTEEERLVLEQIARLGDMRVNPNVLEPIIEYTHATE